MASKARAITRVQRHNEGLADAAAEINGKLVPITELSRVELIRAASIVFPDSGGFAYWKNITNGSIRSAIRDGKSSNGFYYDGEVENTNPRTNGGGSGGEREPEQSEGNSDGEGQGEGEGDSEGEAEGEADDNFDLEKFVRVVSRDELKDDLSQIKATLEEKADGRVTKIIMPDQEEHDLPEQHHARLPLVIQLLAAGHHVFLVGPAGSGKSTLAEQACNALNHKMGSISLGPQTTSSKLFGYMDANGVFRKTVFYDMYKHGGKMLFDEFDNGHPGTTTELNQSISNGVCAFAEGMVPMHKTFGAIATGNTYGRGGDRQYIGRNQLDAATLDRFDFVTVDYDHVLETTLAMAYATTDKLKENITDWIDHVRLIRNRVEEQQLPLVVSPRASIFGAQLLACGVRWKDVEEVRLTGSWDKETRVGLGLA